MRPPPEVERRFSGGDLACFSDWITPTMVPVRFDARFYVALVAADVIGVADGVEMDDVGWFAPSDALQRFAAGRFVLPLPTRKTLDHFARLGSAAAILRYARRWTSSLRSSPASGRRKTHGSRLCFPASPGSTTSQTCPRIRTRSVQAVRVTTIDGEPIPELGG